MTGFRHSRDEDSDYAGLYEVAGEIARETPKAVLFHDGTKTEWLPKSRIKIVRDSKHETAAVVFMPEWLAKQKGLV